MASAAQSPDITLLFGVAGGGSIDGESGKLIKSELNEIVNAINSKPFEVKIKYGLSSTKADLNQLTKNIEAQLKTIGNENAFSIKISGITIGASTVKAFKKQLQEMVDGAGVSIPTSSTNVTSQAKTASPTTSNTSTTRSVSSNNAINRAVVESERLAESISKVENEFNKLNSREVLGDVDGDIKSVRQEVESFNEQLKAVTASEGDIDKGLLNGLLSRAKQINSSISNVGRQVTKLKQNDIKESFSVSDGYLKDINASLQALGKLKDEIAEINAVSDSTGRASIIGGLDNIERLSEEYSNLKRKSADLKALGANVTNEQVESLNKEAAATKDATAELLKNVSAQNELNKSLAFLESSNKRVSDSVSSLGAAYNSINNKEPLGDIGTKIQAVERDFNDFNNQFASVMANVDTADKSTVDALNQKGIEIKKNATELRKIVDRFTSGEFKLQFIDPDKSIKEIDSAMKKLNKLKDEIGLSTKDFASEGMQNVSYRNVQKYGRNEVEAYKNISNRYAELTKELTRLKALGAEASESQVRSLTKETETLKDANAELLKNVFARKDSIDATNRMVGLQSKAQRFISANSKAGGTYGYYEMGRINSESASMIQAVEDGGTVDLNKLAEMERRFKQIDATLGSAGKKGKSFGDAIRSAYARFGGWTIITRTLTSAWHSVQMMYQNVVELDTAMTELKKVTNETDDTYEKFLINASNRSKELGATLADTVNATADFARLGYSIDDASSLADAAIVYKNVGDGITDISVASSSIISTMKAFGIEAEDAMTIVDKFNEVGNNFAISSVGIGDALMNSASALVAANNTLDESIALITAANNVIQDPDKVGTALKTVSMYLRAAKTEAEEAGESTDGMAESVSELRKELLSLTGGKVDIQLDNDTFKSTYEIIKDLSEVWDELTDITRANILELIGGKRNSNVVTALITNFETAEQVVETSADAAGSALAENEKYLDSIMGKISKFQSTFEDLSSSIINSDLVKNGIDFLTDVLNILTKITDSGGALATVGGLAGFLKGISTPTNDDYGLLRVSDFFDFSSNKFKLADAPEGRLRAIGDRILEVASGFNTVGENGKRAKEVIDNYNKGLIDLDDSTQEFNQSTDVTQKAMKSYLSSVEVGSATLQGYTRTAQAATIAQKGFNIVAQAGRAIVEGLVGLAVGAAINFAISEISELVVTSEELIERAQEINTAFNNAKDSTTANIKTLEGLREEYDELSKGVDAYGRNITLTTEEYERYKEIVEDIVEISPSIAEGYSIENGYLVERNDLLEKAIELEKERYRASLRDVIDTKTLRDATKGNYEAYKKELNDLNSAISDTNLVTMLADTLVYDRMTGVSLRDRPERISSNLTEFLKYAAPDDSRWRTDILIGQLERAAQNDMLVGDEDIKNILSYVIEKYGDYISLNIDDIISKMDYRSLGFDSQSDLENSFSSIRDKFLEFAPYAEELKPYSDAVSSQFSYVAEANKQYAELGGLAQSLVNDYVSNFDAEYFRALIDKGGVIDKNVIEDIKDQINGFIAAITPEMDEALNNMTDVGTQYIDGEIDVSTFKDKIISALSELESLGMDDEAIGIVYESSGLKELDEEIEQINAALGATRGQYNDMLYSLTKEELDIAYEIVNANGSMSIDEFTTRLNQAKNELNALGAETVDVLDVSEMITGLDEAKDGIDSIVSAVEKLNEGTALTREELARLALEYPKLLEASNLFTEGSVDGQKSILDAVLSTKQAEYNAVLDEKIAELKAAEQVINDQIKLETEKANILTELNRISKDGILGQEREFVGYLNDLNDLQGQNYVNLKDGELQVNSEALQKKMEQDGESVVEAVENIWEPYGSAIISAHVKGYEGALAAEDAYEEKLSEKIFGIADKMNTALEAATREDGSIDYAKLAKSASGFKLAESSTDANTIKVPLKIDVELADGSTLDITDKDISDWVSNQTDAQVQRLTALEEYREKVVQTYKNLEALRDDLDLVGIYGSASSSSSSSAGSDLKSIEEYTALIDKYYAAEKRLAEIQRRRETIEKQLEHTENLADKIRLTGQLIELYKDEAQAQRDLADAKKETISANVAALRSLGFEVDYNSSTNRLYIHNLEHLNELTASSVGEYESLQEATNALRQETEELIDTTEQLNDENIEAATAIEDLMYDIVDAKNAIIDSIEEIYNSQIESYQKIIDLKKELIQTTKDELDYESSVSDLVEEIADLQTRIDLLSLDDSLSAQAERNSLMEELAQLQDELASTQSDHSTDAQIGALDKLAENYEAQKQNEIEQLRNTVNMSESIWGNFYQTMMGQNVMLGNSINSQISGAWINAAQAVNNYSSAVNGLASGNAGGILLGMGTYIPSNSLPMYHDGGLVNNSNLGNDEVLAILKKGEYVLSEGNKLAVYKMIDFQSELADRLNSTVGSYNSGLLSNLKRLFDYNNQPISNSTSTSNAVFEPNINVTIYGNTGTTDSDAKKYGEKVADAAIEKMYDAFNRRGISSTKGARLRPTNG